MAKIFRDRDGVQIGFDGRPGGFTINADGKKCEVSTILGIWLVTSYDPGCREWAIIFGTSEPRAAALQFAKSFGYVTHPDVPVEQLELTPPGGSCSQFQCYPKRDTSPIRIDDGSELYRGFYNSYVLITL